MTSCIHSWRAYRPLQLVDTWYKFLSITADCVHAKNRLQHWENSRLDCLRFRHMPCSPVDYFMLLLIQIFSKNGCLKAFLNAQVKSLMLKCTSHGFQSDRHSQCSWPKCTQGWDAVLWSMCFAWTAYSHSLKTNGSTVTIAINTYHEHLSKENWMTSTLLYEMDNFIDIFSVNFAEKKRPNFKTLYLLFYCNFEVISNTGLKSRICSDRLQNFIFVQWELALVEAVKRSDPVHDSQKKGAKECVPACENKSSIKFRLLPQKSNKSKWHSTKIFFNSSLTIFIHTASRKCLWLVQNIYSNSKRLTHHFQHFSSSAKGV